MYIDLEIWVRGITMANQ